MDESTLQPWQESNENGGISDLRSLCASLDTFRDPHKARGKRHHLTTVLVIIFVTNRWGQATPLAMAEGAKHYAAVVVHLVQVHQTWMPHHTTIRRVFQHSLDEAECHRLMQASQQQAKPGEHLASDGKTVRGTRSADGAPADHRLRVDAVHHQRVLAHGAVGRTEHAIGAVPSALAQVVIASTISTGDALHAQRALAAQMVARGGDDRWVVQENPRGWYHERAQGVAAATPRPGDGTISTDGQHADMIKKVHGHLEQRRSQTSAMRNADRDWSGLGQVYRLERHVSGIRQGKVITTSPAVEDGSTSLSRAQAAPMRVLQVRRTHGRIEPGVQERREITVRDDATRMTNGTSGHMLATIPNVVLAWIKQAGVQHAAQARRWFDGHIQQAFALLISEHVRL